MTMFSRIFLRLLAIVYFIAFVSLIVQVQGLIGNRGILPVGEFLKVVSQYFGPQRFWQAPTLCWLNSSDDFLLFLCGAGMAFSVILFLGILPWLSAFALWVLYLSLTIAGQEFLAFQWDNLLLQVGFISIFLFTPSFSQKKWHWNDDSPSIAVIWLLRWLLFQFMLESGLVKILSGDHAWKDLTALTYHYLTQPLPNIISWHVYQWSVWFHKLSCFVMFVIELVAPFLIFCGRRARIIAFFILSSFQLLIFLTGNYGFFNLLTIALCFSLLPMASLSFRAKPIVGIIAAIIFLLSILEMPVMLGQPFPKPLYGILRAIEPFRTINTYGLFAVMTTERDEIIIEGSRDGVTWLPYEFHWKPGEIGNSPRWAAPHQPRLDWQMWFAALSDYRRNPWLVNLMVRLLEGSKPVGNLFAKNPFPDAPPKYIRAAFYEYHFTDPQTRKKTGAWWRREWKGFYLPAMGLKSDFHS